PGELDKGVGATLNAGALVSDEPLFLERVECGLQDGAAFGVEPTFDIEHAVPGLAEMKVAPLVVVVRLSERPVGILAITDDVRDVAEVAGIVVLGGLQERRLVADN